MHRCCGPAASSSAGSAVRSGRKSRFRRRCPLPARCSSARSPICGARFPSPLFGALTKTNQAIELQITQTCTAGFTYSGAPGSYDVAVAYYDVNTGAARYRVRAAGKVVGQWTASDRLPTRKLDGSSATRRVLRGVRLRKGDRIEIEGTPEGSETAALDYVEVTPIDSGGSQRPLNSASTTPRTPTAAAR